MRRILLLCFAAVFTLASSELWAQERTVSGRITSTEDGTALPGVNVILKGTTSGTTTDADGRYTISIPSGAEGTLIFSFIGVQTQEIEVGTRTIVDVQMSTDVTQLSEVVVTAFGIERSRDELTYVAEKIDNKKVNMVQQTTAAQGLAGKIAGLQINVQNNGVNPTSQVLLRGLRSVGSDNGALIVIDGVISTQGAFDDLNPNDIEAYDVLKGANAAALYGANAVNGALIITTKGMREKAKKFTVGLNTSYTLEEVAYMPDFQTKHGIGWAGEYDPIENTNWGPRFDGVPRRIGPDFPDGYPVADQIVPYGPIQNNLRDFYQTGATNQNNLYFQGGSEQSSFYLSIGNMKRSGIIEGDDYEKMTVRVNAKHKIGKLELSLNSSFFKDETDIVGNTIGHQDRPLYWFILNTPANIPLTSYKDWKNPAGYGYADNYYNAYYQNPYWAIGTNRNMDETTRLTANFGIRYDILKNIAWDTKIGVNSYRGTGKNWRARQTYNEDLQPSHATVSSYVKDDEYMDTYFNGSSLVTGNFEINENFTVKAILGTQFLQEYQRFAYIQANNLSIPDFYDVSNGTGQFEAGVDERRQREVAAFADVTIGFRKFLSLNLTGRQDYTSTLRKGNNSYFYPQAGLSVVLSEAIDAIKNSNIISYAKLSASSAVVYNDLAAYQINERYSQGGAYPYGGVNGFVLSTQTVDANIKKEKVGSTEFGADLGFLNDRFSLSAAYFITKTTDNVVPTTPSSASGANSFLTNIGELEGKGVEITLGGRILEIGDFKWDFSANYFTYETVVNEIREDIKEIAIDNYNTYGTFAIVGMPFPQMKAVSYVRDNQGRVVINEANGNPIVGEVTAMGKTTPDYNIGATNTFSFKGLSLGATIDYRTGHVYYEVGSDQMEFTGRSIASTSTNRQDFVWPNSVIQTGDDTYVPNTNIPITGGVMTFWQNTYNDIKENYVKDATAFKLREVALNYEVPASLLSKTKVINKLTLGFIARNVLTFLPEENRFADPEFNNFGEGERTSLVGDYNANSIGVGGFQQSPPTRSYGVNLTIEF